MKLKTCTLLCVLACMHTALHAQPVMVNCENFSVGTVLKFQVCNSGATAGPAGAGLTWDFTGLSPLPDTAVEWMVAPSSTPFGGIFPTANLVEKYSNGTFVYMYKTADTNYMVGYADSVHGDTIFYPNTMTFAVRPMAYGNVVTDTFTDSFASPTYRFRGRGVCTITADAYGTLKLPGKTYYNTLRIKIAQPQNDTSSGVPMTATTVSYVWFDSSYSSALLKIDSTNSSGIIAKSVLYLLSQTPNEVPAVPASRQCSIYPNPAMGIITISGLHSGSLHLYNSIGQQVVYMPVHDNTQTDITHLPAGLYIARVCDEHGAIVKAEQIIKLQ